MIRGCGRIASARRKWGVSSFGGNRPWSQFLSKAMPLQAAAPSGNRTVGITEDGDGRRSGDERMGRKVSPRKGLRRLIAAYPALARWARTDVALRAESSRAARSFKSFNSQQDGGAMVDRAARKEWTGSNHLLADQALVLLVSLRCKHQLHAADIALGWVKVGLHLALIYANRLFKNQDPERFGSVPLLHTRIFWGTGKCLTREGTAQMNDRRLIGKTPTLRLAKAGYPPEQYEQPRPGLRQSHTVPGLVS